MTVLGPTTIHVGMTVWMRSPYDRRTGMDAWRERQVIGENRSNWLISEPRPAPGPVADWELAQAYRVPKKADTSGDRTETTKGTIVLLSLAAVEREVADFAWSTTHRTRIFDTMLRLDVDKLRKVAELIGYDEITGDLRG